MKLVNKGPKVVKHMQIKRIFLEVKKDELREREGEKKREFHIIQLTIIKGVTCQPKAQWWTP